MGSREPTRLSRRHPLKQATAQEAKQFGDTFLWQERGPLDFLALLRKRVKGPTVFYTVHGRHVGWLQESDIPRLIALLDSREPCLHVIMSISSYLPRTPSFVGQEALFMIEGFRRGEYPPSLHSTEFYNRKAEIVAWWNQTPHPSERNR